jgi:deoxyribodipyrimidine photo-lyase
MDSAIVVFTRDLRLHDNPALHQARTLARQVVPLFVADPALDATRRSPNRARFLAGSLAGLREALRERGADLVIRAGEPAAAVIQLAREVNAGAVYLAGDVSHYAAARRARLERECARHRIDLTFTPGLTVVPPGLAAEPPLAAAPAGRLRREPRRPGRRPDLAPVRYLRFGCVSPLEVAIGALDHPGGEAFCRQLAWRDFFHQVTAAFPDIARKNYRPGAAWHTDQHALDAWRAGQTGIPVVDAGLRQLAAEGFMHNRARMITASFLTRNLGIDWRHGYQHFDCFLADGDVANNAGNWQWVAGTGNNTRPNRVMNPLRQAQRFDKSGDYVRRYVPELASLGASAIQAPWKLPAAQRERLGYPGPIVELS